MQEAEADGAWWVPRCQGYRVERPCLCKHKGMHTCMKYNFLDQFLTYCTTWRSVLHLSQLFMWSTLSFLLCRKNFIKSRKLGQSHGPVGRRAYHPHLISLEFPETTVHREKLSCHFHTCSVACADVYMWTHKIKLKDEKNDVLTYKGIWQSVSRRA